MAKYHNKVYSFQKVNGGKQHEGVLAQDKSSKTKTRRAAVLWLILCLLFSIWFWLFNNYNSAAVRDLTEEHIEICRRLPLARSEIAVRHRQLIKVREHG